jgi:hypothetical protein
MDTTRSVPPTIRLSPLVLADRLIALASEADRAGMPSAAGRLVKLAVKVCDEKAVTPN